MDTIIEVGCAAATAVCLMASVATMVLRAIMTFADLAPHPVISSILRQGQCALSAIPAPLNFEGGLAAA